MNIEKINTIIVSKFCNSFCSRNVRHFLRYVTAHITKGEIVPVARFIPNGIIVPGKMMMSPTTCTHPHRCTVCAPGSGIYK